MRRFGLFLLAGLLVFCAACRQAEDPSAADTPGYETDIPAMVALDDPAAAAEGSAALTGSFSALQRYEITPPDLSQEQMETVMTQVAQRGGVEFIDTEEQWEEGRVVGTRALCSNGLVIRVWSDGTMKLIWPQTLDVSADPTGDVLADSEALYRAYYEAYADYLQFADPVFRLDSASEAQTGDRYRMVVLDGAPTEARPFPAQARFIPGDEERGDQLEVTFYSGEAKPLGQQPILSPEAAAEQLSAHDRIRAVCLTYGRAAGTATYEPVYVFYLEDPEAKAYRTEILSAIADSELK